MKNKKILVAGIVSCLMIAIVSIAACSGKKSGSGEASEEDSIAAAAAKPLNISIYLDLSNRLLAPNQIERDTAIVSYITEIVKQHAVDQQILPAEDRIKVFLYPAPNNSKVNTLCENLEMDLSKAKPAEKKQMLISFQDKFRKSLSEIYQSTLQEQNWCGSDIWGFFDKPVDTFCMKEGSRNIIVILTDGYIYEENDLKQDGNNLNYITPKTLQDPNNKLMISRKGLDNLEVLMLEVNPTDPTLRDRFENTLTDWFKGMGVQHLFIGETDVPSSVRLYIDNFFK